ncbi:hypothetical protein ACIA47_04740 [Micromonospora sp. NPDC051227]|uniref:hypothetical protein n=1 Tax=Micromonospora sp. NPDC051227 TaxID=3364285 RepID=UPI00379319FE
MVAVEDAPPIRASRPAPPRRVRAAVGETVPVIALLGAFFVVNDIRSWLTAQYWGDEAWVALSVRFPLTDLPVTTSSSPIGWSFLLRLVPDIDDLRVVPLGFQLLSVVAAYFFGRAVGRNRAQGILIGLVAGLAVLLLPAQQTRHDLKQYTADAAVAVCLLALAAWTEQSWSRWRLAVVVAVVFVGMLVSHTTAIIAPCVFGGLLFAAAVLSRHRSKTVRTAVAGLAAGGLAAAVYFGVSVRADNDAMHGYWTSYFPTLASLPGYLVARISNLLPLLGVPGWVLASLLLLGVLTLVRQGRPGTGVAVLLVPVVAAGLGLAQIYPLLDLRTSHFLLVLTAVVAGVGVAGLADLVAMAVRRSRPVVVSSVICALLLSSYAVANQRWWRFDGDEAGLWRNHSAVTTIGSATRYVATHAGPNDIVVVAGPAWFGFALYSDDPLELVAPVASTVGFTVGMPNRPNVVLPQVDPAGGARSIQRALDEILAQASTRPPGTQVWLVRTYTHPSEPDWRAALAAYQVRSVTAGPEPVVVISRR